MLKTRVLYLNGEWDEFVEYRIQKEQESGVGHISIATGAC